MRKERDVSFTDFLLNLLIFRHRIRVQTRVQTRRGRIGTERAVIKQWRPTRLIERGNRERPGDVT